MTTRQSLSGLFAGWSIGPDGDLYDTAGNAYTPEMILGTRFLLGCLEIRNRILFADVQGEPIALLETRDLVTEANSVKYRRASRNLLPASRFLAVNRCYKSRGSVVPSENADRAQEPNPRHVDARAQARAQGAASPDGTGSGDDRAWVAGGGGARVAGDGLGHSQGAGGGPS